MIKMDYRYN
ncbi:hypothetical protein VTH06DRAFT_4365 [Thermothelomyces fergusii]